MSDCPICAKHAGVGPLAGLPVWSDDLVVVTHRVDGPAGYLFTEPRRHAASWSELTEAEGAAIGRVGVRLARALRTVLDVEAVHTFVAGLAVPHFHQHSYVRPTGTPADAPWWPPPPVSGDPAVVAARLAVELGQRTAR